MVVNGDHKDSVGYAKSFSKKGAINTTLLAFHIRDEFLETLKIKRDM